MATVIHLEATVQPDGRIEVSAPELPPGTRVHVTLEPKETPHEPKRRAIDIINEAPGHLAFKTAEEVDAYINEERNSWDR